ncbi:hypothetical protein [Herbidospora daliensis]|uniref:hypothetical protein n=1 Tax=Herbidospora daliensis TaxID=295585 RepID=UPI0007818BAD|nr:hypothetical protein [Herbidospora daliensis]
MTTRRTFGRSPIATSRPPIQPPRPDASELDWRKADLSAEVRVVDTASPADGTEYELCASHDTGEPLLRIRWRTSTGTRTDRLKETAPAPEPEVALLWADLLAGRAR